MKSFSWCIRKCNVSSIQYKVNLNGHSTDFNLWFTPTVLEFSSHLKTRTLSFLRMYHIYHNDRTQLWLLSFLSKVLLDLVLTYVQVCVNQVNTPLKSSISSADLLKIGKLTNRDGSITFFQFQFRIDKISLFSINS